MNAARTPVFSCRKFSNWLVILAGVLISPIGQAQTFNDVPPDYWAYSSVENLAASGITGGCGGGSYCPENFVTRAQMAVFLERGMNGSSFSPPAASGNIFLDVSTTDFAANHIEQLFLDGVTGGCGGNNYCPDDRVTRAQMAVFLLRAKHGANYSPPAPTGVFADAGLGHWAVAWIEQLAAEGITSGCGGGDYCPEDDVTRAQMAVFLVRTFGLNSQPPPADVYAEPARLNAFGSLGKASDGRALQPYLSAIADLNGDGLDDAVVHLVREGNALSSPGELTPVVILLNNGAGTLVPGNSDSPPLGGVPGATPIIDGSAPKYFYVRQVLIEDFNQDGQPDIFFETHGIEPEGNPDLFPGEQNGLWLSGPDGKLTDSTATHLPQHLDFTHGSAAADIDGDNDLDIWVNNLGANDVPAYLLTNDGSGRFTAVADLGFGGPGDNGPGLGPNGRLPEIIRNGNLPFWSAFVDVDSDGDEDLYLGYIGFDDGVATDERAVLLLNDSTGVFSLAPSDAVPEAPFGGIGRVQDLSKYDLNSDGRQDLVLSVSDGNPDNFLAGTEFQFLINNGAGGFDDETVLRFPPQADTATAREETWFADLDGDGDDDFMTGTFDRREIYENDGSGVFTLVEPAIFDFDWWFLPLDIDGDGQGTDFLHVRGNDDGELEFFVTKRDNKSIEFWPLTTTSHPGMR